MKAVWVAAGIATMFALPGWADGVNPQKAAWKEQQLTFYYAGRTARYSCQGLRDKVRSLLLDLGARRDLKVSVLACNESALGLSGGAPGPNLGIVFSSPAMRAAGAGQPAAGEPAAGEPGAPGDAPSVDARFMPFTLSSDVFRNLGLGDCELIEEFTRQILPKLTTRDVKQDIACLPNQMSGSRFFVRGEVLKATSPSP
jgi:hypothetical protein